MTSVRGCVLFCQVLVETGRWLQHIQPQPVEEEMVCARQWKVLLLLVSGRVEQDGS